VDDGVKVHHRIIPN